MKYSAVSFTCPLKHHFNIWNSYVLARHCGNWSKIFVFPQHITHALNTHTCIASESALTVQSLEYALPVKGTTAKHRERMTVPIGNGR